MNPLSARTVTLYHQLRITTGVVEGLPTDTVDLVFLIVFRTTDVFDSSWDKARISKPKKLPPFTGTNLDEKLISDVTI